jgi:hypothetical protein
MFDDTISFIILVSCFVIIMASVFTTLYQDENPILYGSLSRSIRSLFDAALAVYEHTAVEKR